ncbi:MAG: hypothetical protein E6Q97_00280 [Desulfurellales bacterium]|nr:MAG: hypothetical protein E6Q97_00280 [Desulfurellales bacterium]
MANRKKQEQQELRELIKMAVEDEVYKPDDVLEYIIDNGWKYADPTKMTIIKLLNENGVEYVGGYWGKL